MAHIQPSFLHFYLFRTRQNNTSFLLTSKDELKYPGGSFLNNPNFYPFGQQHFPLKNNSKPSPQIFRYIQRDRQDFAHTLNSLIFKPLFQISKITVSKIKSNPIPGGIPLTSQYFNTTKFSNPFYGDFPKYPVRQIFSNFLNPYLGEMSTKPGMASTSTQNRSHSRETPQNNFHSFSKHRSLPTALTTNMSILQTTSLMPRNPPRSRIKILSTMC